MLKERLLVILFLLPGGILLIVNGGIPYNLLIGLILGISGWEYVRMFHKGGWKPGYVLVIGGVIFLAAARSFFQFQYSETILSILTMVAMAYHLFQYEKGRNEAGIDFCISMAGILYLGWLGSYMISLRNLTDGLWWLLLTLPTVWLIDSGAYIVGSWLGKHKMTPRPRTEIRRQTFHGESRCRFPGIVG